MKILLVHNDHGIFTGEEAVVYAMAELLRQRDHAITMFIRSSKEIPRMRFGKIKAFCSGIYSLSSKQVMRRLLREQRPDVVHIHNLFPFISPSVIGECSKASIPVVMTVHNYRLLCPTGLYATDGKICEKCDEGEYWCVLRNCTGSLPKSIGYALRNYVARKGRFFLDDIAIYTCLTRFQKEKLIRAGFPQERIIIAPNTVTTNHAPTEDSAGDFVGFVGRVSPEKGIETLLIAAGKCPSIPFKAAGGYNAMPDVPDKAPPNLRFLGKLRPENVAEFYGETRIVVFPSICFEGFPIGILEAMLQGKPVVCSRIGGLPEIVDDGVTGLLFEPADPEDLADKIHCLWHQPRLCREMGSAGREKVLRQYSPQNYYERLMTVYKKAIELAAMKDMPVGKLESSVM